MLHDTTLSIDGRHPEHAAGWTEERVELLKTLWSEGKSASEIAAILKGGLTRNGVLGKIHRLKLDKRVTVSIRAETATGGNGSAGKHRGIVDAARKARTKGQPKAAAISHRMTMGELKPPKPLPIPKDLPEISARRRLIDLGAHECRYCTGDPLTADHSFCGRPVKAGTSWCEKHYAVVFPRRVP
jgi:GcrA cell cycle regulator